GVALGIDIVLLHVVFVFQAEDGIRDFHVTGVQTCALPIWIRFGRIMLVIAVYALIRITWFLSPDVELLMMVSNPLIMEKAEVFRSEERRVGKECRSGWSAARG